MFNKLISLFKRKEVFKNPDEETATKVGCSLLANYVIHGGWGDHIEWLYPEEFNGKLSIDTGYGVWGHVNRIPKVGNTLLSEFEKSFIKFVFVEVNRETDPPDMFFAKVKIIDQDVKEQK